MLKKLGRRGRRRRVHGSVRHRHERPDHQDQGGPAATRCSSPPASSRSRWCLKQAQEQRLAARSITTGGSSSPTQLIKQAGAAAEGTYHILFFMPWFPEAMPDGKLAKAFVDEWAKRGHPFEGLTEGFRGHDGIAHHRRGDQDRRQGRPQGRPDALWKVNIMGVNGPIKFEKDGPAGKESGQSKPSIFLVADQGRQDRAAGVRRPRSSARPLTRGEAPRADGAASPAPAERAAAGRHLQPARHRPHADLRPDERGELRPRRVLHARRLRRVRRARRAPPSTSSPPFPSRSSSGAAGGRAVRALPAAPASRASRSTRPCWS